MSKQQRFASLVDALTADLYRYAVWLSRDPSVADDLVQETLLRAWKSLDSLRDEKAAKRWLITILRRENARRFERIRPDLVDVDEVAEYDQRLAVKDESTDIADLRAALMQLDEAYREPLVLQVHLGFSTREIADTMDLTEGAVLTRLFRARKKLRTILEEGEGAEAWTG